jgi:hypothetical protein
MMQTRALNVSTCMKLNREKLQKQARIFPGQISTELVKVSEDEHQFLSSQTLILRQLKELVSLASQLRTLFLTTSQQSQTLMLY